MRYDIMLNMLKTAVVALDHNFHVRYVNEAALAILETSTSQITERPFYELFVDDGFDKVRFHNAMLHSEDFSETEVLLCFKDGRAILTDITASFFTAQEAQDVSMLLEINCIDKQRKITQETLHYAQQQAARDLIRGLAHEIKNPLGGIRGAAQLLEKELKRESDTEFTRMIIDQSDRLVKLVDRLLGPNTLPKKRDINLHEVIEKVRSVIELDPSHHIQITRDYDPSIPDFYADSDMLQQALLNIARNSMQALSDSQISDPQICFKSRIDRQVIIKGVQHPLCAVVSVVDNGPGIPSEVKDTLFYPMVSSKSNGSGLGLSIAQTLTDHHDGKIEVSSHLGFTEFSLYLPLIKRVIQDA